MTRLFLFGLFCLLRKNLVSPSPINYEYKPPPVKGSHVFMAVLEEKIGTNETIEQFMYHYKHGLFTSAFLSEIFSLGIGTHLFDNRIIDYPSDEERRIAITVTSLWEELANMRKMNRITMKVSNDTAHYYLQSKERNDTGRYLFTQLEEVIKADPVLNKVYIERKKLVDPSTLPPLTFVNINLTKFVAIEKQLEKTVWVDPKSFLLIANARFSQHLETELINATKDDYDNVLLAHLLEEEALNSEQKENVQKAYDQTIGEAANKAADLLKLRDYYEFDHVLFTTLNEVIKKYPSLSNLMILIE